MYPPHPNHHTSQAGQAQPSNQSHHPGSQTSHPGSGHHPGSSHHLGLHPAYRPPGNTTAGPAPGQYKAYGYPAPSGYPSGYPPGTGYPGGYPAPGGYPPTTGYPAGYPTSSGYHPKQGYSYPAAPGQPGQPGYPPNPSSYPSSNPGYPSSAPGYPGSAPTNYPGANSSYPNSASGYPSSTAYPGSSYPASTGSGLAYSNPTHPTAGGKLSGPAGSGLATGSTRTLPTYQSNGDTSYRYLLIQHIHTLQTPPKPHINKECTLNMNLVSLKINKQGKI